MSEVLWHESKLISTQFRFTLSYAYWIIKSKFYANQIHEYCSDAKKL